MTACQKCGGLMLVERDLLDGDAMKCLNCGYRGGAMPRFTSEEGKQRWLASMAAMRGRKRSTKQTAAMAEDGSLTMKAAHSGGIAGALDEIDQKIAALEQVKRHLVQAQVLVNR